MKSFHELTTVGRSRRLRRVVEEAARRYDFEIQRLRLITNETNGVFRIDTVDGRRLVVRVGLGGDIGHLPGQVAAETAFLAHLIERDLPVPRIVRTATGAPFVTVEAPGVPGPRNAVVFTWLPGRPLDEDHARPRQITAFGELAARLHRASEGFRPPPHHRLPRWDRPNPFDEPVVLFDDELVTEHQRRVFAQGLAVVEERIDRLDGPFRVVHGDLHPGNVMVSRRGMAAFDFEDLMWAHPSQDLATSLYYLSVGDRWHEFRAAFREGYERVLPWPEEHAGDVDVFMAGRAIVLANDILIVPEWRSMSATYLPRFAQRVVRFAGLRDDRSG